jgi:hypothetical protein
MINMITSLYTRLKRVKPKKIHIVIPSRKFYQTARTLTAHEIRNKNIQLNHFRKEVSAEQQAAVLHETP